MELEAPDQGHRGMLQQRDSLPRPQSEISCVCIAGGKIQCDIVKLKPLLGHAVLALIERFFGAEDEGGTTTPR